MTTLTKIKLQNDEKGCWGNTAKRTTKRERQAATKRCQKIDKKRAEKSAAAQGENTEISAGKALKIRNCHRLNTLKCYESTDSEYTIEYTKHITNTY